MILSKRPEIEAFARRPDPAAHAALVHGRDRAAVRELGSRLLQALTPQPDDPFTVALLDAGALTEERLQAELTAQSMMGGRRVVHLRGVADSGPTERLAAEALGGHLLSRFNPDAFFLIEADALDKRSALRRAAEAGAAVKSIALYEEESGDLSRLVRETLAGAKLSVSPPLLELIARRLPRDRGLARQALEQLVVFVGAAGGGAVTEADLVALADGETSTAAEATMAAFSGRVPDAVAALGRSRYLGEPGPLVLRMVSGHRARLARIAGAVKDGTSEAAALKSAGVFWKQEREVTAQLALWSASALEALACRLVEADLKCKQAGAPDELIAHAVTLDIARQAARRAPQQQT